MNGLPLALAALGAVALASHAAQRNGSRALLYHGTRATFDTFDLGHGDRKDAGWLGQGAYLATSPAVAEAYAHAKRGPESPRILRFEAHLQRPYRATHEEKQRWSTLSREALSKLTRSLRSRGHDGVVLDLGGSGYEVVVFDPGRVVRVGPPLVLPTLAERRKYDVVARAWLAARGTSLARFGEVHGMAFTGSGEDRAVFALDNQRVLKVAQSSLDERRGEDGDPERDQCGNETRVWREAPDWLRPLLVPVIAASRDGSWIVMERVTTGGHLDAETLARVERAGIVDVDDGNVARDGRIYDYGFLDLERWAVTAGGAAGSSNVVTPAGFDRTATTRGQPSAPVQHLLRVAPAIFRGRVLDFGSGHGADARALRATAYDPHHPDRRVRTLPTTTFDTVLVVYVLNVLPPAERWEALRQAASRVAPGGTLVLAVRPEAEVRAATAGWTRSADGAMQVGNDGTRDRFQRGWTAASFTRDVRKRLPGWVDAGAPGMDGAVLLVLRRPA